jgi:excinuclease ABC subunit A
LRHIDLDVPHRLLTVVCGVSGSGKTSLALDTLYAEGQRRYIESFSAYTRQFLARLEKPVAESIEGIPPAIAVTHKSTSNSSRATVGTATEVLDYMRLLYARLATVQCTQCGRVLVQDSPDSIAGRTAELAVGTKFMVAFRQEINSDSAIEQLREEGFIRCIAGGQVQSLDAADFHLPPGNGKPPSVDVVVDRLTAGPKPDARVRESLETAMEKGAGRCQVLLPANTAGPVFGQPANAWSQTEIDERRWLRVSFSQQLECEACDVEFPRIEPRLFSFNSPMGACPNCEGFGNVMDRDMDMIVPDPRKSIEGGAIAPWNTPAYKHELEELLALADDYDIPVDIPFCQLNPEQLQLIQVGVPEREFGGLDGFFAWLERRKYKMHIRVFLSRWRSYRVCSACHGSRLRSEALTATLGNKNIAEVCALAVHEAINFFEHLELDAHAMAVGQMLLDQIRSRLGYLRAVGLEYLTLDRPLRTLSGGESQRVALTAALGSSLVNMLYVLDEPSVGLHPTDVNRLVTAIEGLRDRGNTVVVVEHDESMIEASDRIVEVGPGAGEDGGKITFEGTVDEMRGAAGQLTGDYLMGRRGRVVPENRRAPNRGWIRLKGATGNNLQGGEIEFPLGVLCLVTGVSGAGKSTLVEHTLFPALCRRKGKDAPQAYPYEEVFGDGQLDDVMLIDQSPIGRSPRSNPVTYIKAFDAIRNVYAETLEARTRGMKASHFSFNVDGGRCEACKGDGSVQIDMQFLADIMMECTECQGKRYRREVLDILYRGKSIADVLDMTVRQAYSFFRGQSKVQKRLHQLKEVGLDYLRLGQAANTLSAGEAQRLKLASYLSSPRRGRTLFLLDEPTTGLHFSDIVQLLDCFDALISMGHSLIVVEHNTQMMQAADYIIDVGPGAAEHGGRVVSFGTPEQVAECDSPTGRVLKSTLHV